MGEPEIRQMLQERPERTTTVAVADGVIAGLTLDRSPEMRELTREEIEELARYLGSSANELRGPFHVVDRSCEQCGRRLGFVDFARTGVDSGSHSKEQLREILSGRAGAWVTVRGRDGGRPVSCASCHTLMPPGGYSEYSSSSYAYA